MPQTQIACPRCRRMIPAQVEQLFDVSADPQSKQRLLAGISNQAQCPFCGYQGSLATPIVYHDADKELLLTFFPGELGMPVNEQEKLVGPLITQVTNRLPLEKRKAYLLRPQSFLTFQSLIERILAADGVTKEMLDEQQKRVNLLQRLLQTTAADVRAEIIKQNHPLLDETFFGLLGRLMENAAAAGQQPTVQALSVLQQELLNQSEYGRKLQGQMAEVEAAVKSLQEAGKGLTREKLLDLFIEAPSEERVRALVSLTRNGLDYSFFAILTERIDRASGEGKAKLEALRARLLDHINEIDQHLEEELKHARGFLDQLLAQPDIAKATEQNLDQFNEIVLQAFSGMLREAQQKGDTARLARLQEVARVLQSASAPPPELAALEALLQYDEQDMDRAIAENEKIITPEFMNMLGGLISQLEAQPQDQLAPEDRQTFQKAQALYRAALRFSMKKNLG